MWDPAVYRRFGSERARPFLDLVARIGAGRPRAVTDLGCGPGDLTATLAQRWPQARVTGIDSSPEMIARAGPGFEVGDVRDWHPGPDTDVVVTNAVLQWVPGHHELLARWAAELPPGAWLAMQVPGNFDATSHRALRETAAGFGLGRLARTDPVDDPAGYAGLLTRLGATVDAWETTYLHLLPDAAEHPVLSWLEGTALRPFRAVLDDSGWAAFRTDLAGRLAAHYPARDGHVAFPFRRVFVVAQTRTQESS